MNKKIHTGKHKGMSTFIKILLIILGIFLTLGIFYFSAQYIITKTDFLKYNPQTECIEDGNCDEGVSINIDGELVTITPKTCIDNDGKWDEKMRRCRF